MRHEHGGELFSQGRERRAEQVGRLETSERLFPPGSQNGRRDHVGFSRLLEDLGNGFRVSGFAEPFVSGFGSDVR